MSTALLLIRHGETTWNAIKRMQGQANSPLSERGLEQAKQLKPFLAKRQFATVSSSDLDRTIDTARLAGFATARRCAEWREIDVGDWSGQFYQDLEKSHSNEVAAWKKAEFTPPNAESWEQFVARIAGAVKSMERTTGEQDETHLVFTHGLVVKAAYCILTGIHHTKVPPVSNCSWSGFDLTAFDTKGPGMGVAVSFNQTRDQIRDGARDQTPDQTREPVYFV